MIETSLERSTTMPRPSVLNKLRRYLITINRYTDEQALSINDQFFATRLYIGLLSVSIFVLLVFTGLNEQTQGGTLILPTLSQFELLSNQYPSTLSCPCSEVTIPHNTFLSFAPQYHQVCSSEFVLQPWISSLFSINTSDYFVLDFRTSASSQFQVVALLCQTAVQSVSDALEQFGMQQLITSRTLSRSAFDAQSAALVQQLQTTSLIDTMRMDQFVSLSISQNHLVSALGTNYFIYSVPGTGYYSTYSRVYYSDSDAYPDNFIQACDCDQTYTCTVQASFFTNWSMNIADFFYSDPPTLFSVPGMLAGCIPRYSIFQSTLECFYNSTCLDMIGMYLGDKSSHRPLDATVQTRFQPNTTIQSIFDELLIEAWYNTSNFSGYFHRCAPDSCSYTYIQQFNVVYMLITLLSLIGGLTVILHFLVPLFVNHFLHRMQTICCRRAQLRQQVPLPNEEVARPSKCALFEI
jgi:hypothetical protein